MWCENQVLEEELFQWGQRRQTDDVVAKKLIILEAHQTDVRHKK